MKLVMTTIALLSLAACTDSAHDDLTQFVKESGANLRGKVEPLPEMRPYQPLAYNAFDIPDPFKPRKLKPSAGGGGGLQPDMTRPKEPLESFALETLKMVGVLKQKNDIYAVVKTPENTIYRIRTGNYLGQNFGKVLSVTDDEVQIKETVQDSAGDWAQRNSTLTLQEQ